MANGSVITSGSVIIRPVFSPGSTSDCGVGSWHPAGANPAFNSATKVTLAQEFERLLMESATADRNRADWNLRRSHIGIQLVDLAPKLVSAGTTAAMRARSNDADMDLLLEILRSGALETELLAARSACDLANQRAENQHTEQQRILKTLAIALEFVSDSEAQALETAIKEAHLGKS